MPICDFPCASCKPNNPTQCTSCIYGFSLNGNTCTMNPCSTSNCLYCPFGQVLLNATCTSCTAANCERCVSNQTSVCQICNFGFYLDSSNSQCSQCPVGCSTCNTNSYCTSCQVGYILVASALSPSALSPSLSFQGSCLACQAPCAQCFATPQTCITCIQNFTLVGWSCVSNFHYIFTATFTVGNQ